MKKLLIAFLLPFCLKAQYYIEADSVKPKLHFTVSAGLTLNSYYAKEFSLSPRVFDYRFGVGVTKDLKNNLEATANIWLQQSDFNDLKTHIYDSYYKADVFLQNNIQLQQLYISGEINKKYKHFYFGINAGVNYLIKSQTTQLISTDASRSAAINIYNYYSIPDYAKDSYYNIINPFAGISISYFPVKWLGIKYQNNFDVFSNPQQGYQFFKKINSFTNAITLTLKTK